MKNRNPPKSSQRLTEANARKTEAMIEKYHGKVALLRTWESQPDEVQIKNHDYIIRQRATVRMCKNLILHRADPNANL